MASTGLGSVFIRQAWCVGPPMKPFQPGLRVAARPAGAEGGVSMLHTCCIHAGGFGQGRGQNHQADHVHWRVGWAVVKVRGVEGLCGSVYCCASAGMRPYGHMSARPVSRPRPGLPHQLIDFISEAAYSFNS